MKWLHPRLREQLSALDLDAGSPPSVEAWHALLDTISTTYQAISVQDADMDCAVFTFSPEGKFIDTNLRGEALLGVPREAIINADMGEYVAAPERADQLDRMALLLEGKEIPPYVRYFLHVDGTRIPTEVHASLIRDAHGEPLCIRSVVRDLTEYAPTKELLISERDLLSTVINALPEQVYAKDRNRRYVACNTAHARLLGAAAPDEVLGRTKRDFFPDEHVSRFDEEDDRVFRTGESMLNVEAMSVHGDERRWYLVSKFPLKDADGEIVGLVGVVQEVTSLKQMQFQLAESRDQALQTARLKSEFLATMSHEIRTPMSSVLGIVELLRLTPLTDEQAEFMQLLDSEAHHLLRVINDILDFSKIEAGRVVLDSVPMRFEDVVKSVFDLYRGRVHDKGLNFTWEIEPDLPTVRGDPGRLRQILLNLVDNAIKFTAQGEIGIALQLLRSEPGAAIVRCHVRDTGMGIPAKVINRLFKPFTQADGSMTRRFGGTGLGLAIVRGLVEQMGGQIGVESIEGSGTVCWFTLRLELADEQPATVSSDEPMTNDSAMPVRILIAEDDANNRQLALDMVGHFGCRADAVTCGVEAVKVYSLQPNGVYDLILMDCQMPEMDGLEATRRIRALEAEHGGHIPIIAMTVLIQPENRTACLEAGMDDYVTKPVPMKDLRRIIARWLPLAQS